MWFAVMRLARDHVKADKNGRSAMVTVENFTATHAREVVQPLLPPVGRHTFEPMEGDLKLMQEDMLRHSVHHIGSLLLLTDRAVLSVKFQCGVILRSGCTSRYESRLPLTV